MLPSQANDLMDAVPEQGDQARPQCQIPPSLSSPQPKHEKQSRNQIDQVISEQDGAFDYPGRRRRTGVDLPEKSQVQCLDLVHV